MSLRVKTIIWRCVFALSLFLSQKEISCENETFPYPFREYEGQVWQCYSNFAGLWVS
jgi:hypothetical protein